MSHFHNRIKLLRNPSFLIYIIGWFAAAFGNGLGYIAISWIVVTHNNNVSAIAILMACFWGPNVVLGPLMGVLADRISRQKIIIVSNAARASVFIFFSWYLREHFHVITVYVLTFCIGTAFSIFFSSAMGFMRELVPQQDLMYANSIMDMNYEAGNMIGVGIAGLLIAWTSPETVILINGIAFLIATITVLLISKKALCHGDKLKKQKIRLLADYQAGLSYLFMRKKLMVIYTTQLLVFITFLTSPLLLVPFSKTVLHATVAQFGMIEACSSVGIVIGGIFMPWFSEKCGLMQTLLFFSILLTAIFAIFGFNRSITLAGVMYFGIGFSGAIWPLIITRAQSLTALDFQGRVQSTFNSISGATMMLFYFSMGWMGKHYAVNHLYFIEVIIMSIAVLFLCRSKNMF